MQDLTNDLKLQTSMASPLTDGFEYRVSTRSRRGWEWLVNGVVAGRKSLFQPKCDPARSNKYHSLSLQDTTQQDL